MSALTDFLIESQINTGFALLFSLLKKPRAQRDKFKAAFIKLRDTLIATYPIGE